MRPAWAAPPTFTNVCTGLGINLPTLTPVAAATNPLFATINAALNPIIDGVNSNLQVLSGAPIGLGVLDPSTNTYVNVPASACNVSGNSFQVDNTLGLSLGGGLISGLGGTGNMPATAGDPTAIAFGNNATTAAGAANALAFGTNALATATNGIALGANASATAANSVSFGTNASATAANSASFGTNASATAANSLALGTNALASRGAQPSYSAFGLTGLQSSVGEVSFGALGSARQLTNVAAGSAVTDAVNLGQLEGAVAPLTAASKLAVGYVADGGGNPTAVINLAGNALLPTGTTQVTLTGVAPGALTTGSKDAVNGAQLLATGTSSAAALGAGAIFDATTGLVTAPSFAVQGATYTTVGGAFGALNTAISSIVGGQAGPFAANNLAAAAAPVASGANAIAGGFGASATGAASIAVGSGASDHAVAKSTILGTGASVTAGVGGSNVVLGQGSVAAYGALSAYSAAGLTAPQTSAGEVSVGSTSAPRQVTNVAAGRLATDAVNVGQLQGVGAALGTSLETIIGGGSTYDATTGRVGAPTYTIGATTYTSVASALTALDASVGTGPVQYSTAAAPTMANPGVVSNDVTLVGAGMPVALHNLAGGSIAAGSKDAVNGGQLFAGNQSIATVLGGGATYNTVTGAIGSPTYTIQGTSYTTIGTALNALSGSINGTGSQKYFQVNSNLANASATAPDAVAIGPVAVASGVSAVALGNGATASGSNSVALGAGSNDGGLANVVSVGAPGATRRITNVAAGTLSATSTDAVVGSQLNETNVQLAALSHSAVQYSSNATGQTLSSVTLSSDEGGPVIIHNLAPGVAGSDAATVQQVRAASTGSVQYAVANGIRTNTVALAGGSPGGVTITNLAPGVGPSDAVNVGQLQSYGAGAMNAANAYTDQQFNNLLAYTQTQIRQVREEAAGGTALALAATGLRYDDGPGKTSITGATAYYRDQMGLAFGLGHTSEDGRLRFNVSVSGTPTLANPEIGAVVGVSFALN